MRFLDSPHRVSTAPHVAAVAMNPATSRSLGPRPCGVHCTSSYRYRCSRLWRTGPVDPDRQGWVALAELDILGSAELRLARGPEPGGRGRPWRQLAVPPLARRGGPPIRLEGRGWRWWCSRQPPGRGGARVVGDAAAGHRKLAAPMPRTPGVSQRCSVRVGSVMATVSPAANNKQSRRVWNSSRLNVGMAAKPQPGLL